MIAGRRCGLIVAFILLTRSVTVAQVPENRPFVTHHVALQLSDGEPARQSLVLSVAFNILKSFGPDKVAIEVVAFGPGIELLSEDNPNAPLIRSLVTQGVQFDACVNTIQTIERKSGKPFPLNPAARRVEAGVPQLILLSEHGYTVIRP
jgi:intracellular sulfur oxidation DsrE/DsrF family protein